MMVPLMKRQQHDTLNSKIESQIAELAKVKPTDRDFEEAQKEKQRLNDMMMSQAERLAKEGVNPNSTSDFLKFNRDFQESISPTGKIGMFNDAYKAKELAKADFLKNSTALGYSPEEVQNKLAQIENDYNNTPVYDEKGRVSVYNTDKYMPPKYINHIEEAQKFFKETGIDSREWNNVTSGIGFDEMSNQYVSTSTNGGVRSENDSQRQSVIDFMNSRIANEDGDIRQTLDWRNYDPNKALKEIQQMSGIYAKDIKKDVTGNEISNVKYYDPASGNGSDENNHRVYSHSSETMPVGDNYEKVTKENQAILNNPKSTPQERNMARQKLDLIDEIKDNLIGKGIEESKLTPQQKLYRNKEKYISSINNSKFLDDLIKTAEKEKSPYLNNLKSLQKQIKAGGLQDVSSPNIFFTKGVEVNDKLYEASNLGKYAKELDEFYGKHIKTYQQYNQDIKKGINSSLSTRGLEATKLSYNYKNAAAKDTEMMNLKDALDVDFARASDIIYINNNGSKERIKVDEGIAADAINMLKNSDEKTMNANITHRGNVIGITVKYNPHKDNELDADSEWFDRSFGSGQSIEMFVPILNLSDGNTGMRHTQTRVYNMLPNSLQRKIDKVVSTGNSGSTTQESRLGQNAAPASQYFSKFGDDKKIDFLKGKDKYITPYLINEDNTKRDLKWNDVVDYSKLNDSNYIIKLAQSEITDDIENTYKRTTGKNPIQFSNGMYDYKTMLNEMKNKSIKLNSVDEIIDFSNLNR